MTHNLEQLVSEHIARHPRKSVVRGVRSGGYQMMCDWRPEIDVMLADGWKLRAIAAALPGVTGVSINYDSVTRYLRVMRKSAVARQPDPDRLARLEQAAAGFGGSPKSATRVIQRYASEIRDLLARGYDPEAIASVLSKETGARIDRYKMTSIAGAAAPIVGVYPVDGPIRQESAQIPVPPQRAAASPPDGRAASMSSDLFRVAGPPPMAANGALNAEMEEIKRRLDEKLASDPARQPNEQTKAMLAEIEKMTGESRRDR